MRYEILWVDDDWSTHDAERRGRLDDVQRRISARVNQNGDNIDWVTDERVSDSVTRLHATDADFRLAIVDLDFGKAAWTWKHLWDALEQAHISVVFYTSFPQDVAPHLPRVSAGLSIGVFEKGADDLAFVERVASFCLAPPFRLVHLSDIHFDSTLKDRERADQEALLESLITSLDELQRKRPIDLLVFTGDFAHKDPAVELKAVRPYISRLIGATVTHAGIARCAAVPGNHDMRWENFEDRRPSVEPWTDYADFASAVFATEARARAEMRGWDAQRQLLSAGADGLGLCWNRRMDDPRMNLVGLATTSAQPQLQGAGEFRRSHLDYLRECWSAQRQPGEVRMCLMHHNLMAPVSLSRLDEKTTIDDGGAAMLALLESQCNVVLSGHVHTGQIIRFESVLAGPTSNYMASLIIVGTGPTGGVHAAKDRPRTFSCLEFGDGVSGLRQIAISHFTYSGTYQRWKETQIFSL